jgi:hypothetical protein
MKKDIEEICKLIDGLTDNQILLVREVINQFSLPFVEITAKVDSDIIRNNMLHDFGDVLRIHHCFSHEPFTKDKFEYALVRTLNSNGIRSNKANQGNPGHDIEIEGINASLKTQADKNIKLNELHISKFMELGKGKWGDDPEDLENLRKLFLNHMKSYERILSLRCLEKGPTEWAYELVEIPKALLIEAENGTLTMMQESSQMPKPGYCNVEDLDNNLKFQLYFDGGSERKLQIKKLKKQLCIIHGTWRFQVKAIA